MIDIQIIRDNPELVAKKSKQKGYNVEVRQILELDTERRTRVTQIEELRARRNTLSAELKKRKPTEEEIAEGRQLKEEINNLENDLQRIEEKYATLLKQVPNLPLDDVPVGTSEKENVVVKTWGEKSRFDFEPKSHWELAEARGLIDKERAAKVTGSRFAYIKGDLVKLQLAIMQFVVNALTDEETLSAIIRDNELSVPATAFVPILPPYMIKTDLYDAMDRLEPSEDRYKIEGEDLWLQGSAEHVLGSMYSGEILDENDGGPVRRFLGYATSFRREAGTYGKDTEGIIRMHQFDKLEMESFTVADIGLEEHRFFIAIQEFLVQQLKLPYELLNKCTADIGKPNARGVDINIWMPGQNKYRETHTADYMTDYQTRRLQTRFRRSSGEVELAHTNDATAFALGRIIVAIIENCQTEDGGIMVPEVLVPYMGGITRI